MEECHCDPRVQTNNGDAPLHCACEGGNFNIVRFLIVDHHCDPAGRGAWGRTALHYACESGKLDIVKFLVEESDPTVQNSNSNAPLHFACKKRVRFLIVDRHCDPACCGCNGRTPLHFACESEKLDIVKFLVEEHNCNPFKGKDSVLYTAPLPHDILLYLISCIPPLKLVNSVTKRQPVQLLEVFRK